MSARVVVVATWTGPVVVRRLAVGESDPGPAELAAIARQHYDGSDDRFDPEVAVAAYVVEQFVFPRSDGAVPHLRRARVP